MTRLLILLFTLLTFPLSGQADEYRVMSFNLRYGSANDGDNSWPNRQELVVETIRRFSPDLLGTQETLPFQAEYIGEQLDQYQYVGWSREKNPNGEQCGIFFLRSRFDLIDSGQFWLSENPDEPYTKSWDSSLPRVATWVVLKPKSNDEAPFLFVNTHFDHRGAEARKQSGRLIHERIQKLRGKMPVILTGDFNCDIGSEPYQALTSDGKLVDTYPLGHPEPETNVGTFHGFRGTPGKARIDWVLISPDWNIKSATIDRHHQGDRYPSDHFPVTAAIEPR